MATITPSPPQRSVSHRHGLNNNSTPTPSKSSIQSITVTMSDLNPPTLPPPMSDKVSNSPVPLPRKASIGFSRAPEAAPLPPSLSKGGVDQESDSLPIAPSVPVPAPAPVPTPLPHAPPEPPVSQAPLPPTPALGIDRATGTAAPVPPMLPSLPLAREPSLASPPTLPICSPRLSSRPIPRVETPLPPVLASDIPPAPFYIDTADAPPPPLDASLEVGEQLLPDAPPPPPSQPNSVETEFELMDETWKREISLLGSVSGLEEEPVFTAVASSTDTTEFNPFEQKLFDD